MEVLYDNLENYDETTVFEELKKENIELKLKLEENAIAMQKLQKEFDILGQEFKHMQINYSSLLKTAREEIKRKTDQITQLNQEKDAMVLKSLQNGTNIRRNFPGHNPRGWNRSSSKEVMSKNSNHGKDDKKGDIEPKTERYDNSVAQTKAPSANLSSNSSSSNIDTHAYPLKLAENDYNDRPKPVNEYKEKPKPRSIRDRRKSMPAFESMADENLRYDPPERQYDRFIDRNNYKGYETSNIDRNYTNHDPRRSNVDWHYDSDRGRDKYNVPYRNRSRFSPDKYKRHEKEYARDYHQPEPTRHRDYPPDTSIHYQHRTHDNRLSSNSNKPRLDERLASKHKMSSDYENYQAKRQRLEHGDKHPQFDDRRNKSDKIMMQTILEPGEIYDSCQSPDINPEAPCNSMIREIKLNTTEKLPDPRKVSNKYTAKTENGGALTSVSSGDIRIKPIDKSIWKGNIDAVKVPDALKHNPFSLSEGIAKEIYMDIDKQGSTSPATHVRNNHSPLDDRANFHHNMLAEISSQTYDIRRDKSQKYYDFAKHDKEPQSKVLESTKFIQDIKTKVCELVPQAKEYKNLSMDKKVQEESINTKSELKETKKVSDNETNPTEQDLQNNVMQNDVTKTKKSPKDHKIVECESAKPKNVAKPLLRGTKHISESKKDGTRDIQAKHIEHTEVKENRKISKDFKVKESTQTECDKYKKIESSGSQNVSKDNNEDIKNINDKVMLITDEIKIEKSSKSKYNIEPPKDKNITIKEEEKKKQPNKNSHRTTKSKSNDKTSPTEKSPNSSVPDASLPVITADFSDNITNCNDKHTASKLVLCSITNKRNHDKLYSQTLSKSNIALVENDLELSDDTSDHKDTHRDISPLPKTKHRTKSLSKDEKKITEKFDSNKNKHVKTAKKDAVDSKKAHDNKNRKDIIEDSTKGTVKDAIINNKKSKTKSDCKSLERKNKLSELFGESSSLITPEDLGIPMYGPPPDDAQDAVDIDIRQCIKTQPDNVIDDKEAIKNYPNNTKLPNCIRNELVLEKPPNIDTDRIPHTDNSTFKGVPKMITSEFNDIPNIVYENLDSENKTNDKDVVKTVIISTGIQPQFLSQDNNGIQKVNEPKPIAKHFELNALATSTPHKGSVDSKTDETTCSNENSTSDVHNDAPDVRIFVKRRKRVLKKAPNS